MNNRTDAVLNLQLTLIPILCKHWKLRLAQLQELFQKYDILSYIDTCYETYNSMGIQGIIEDLEEYIKIQNT